MIKKDNIMFYVFYNPIDKDVKKNDDDSIISYNTATEISQAYIYLKLEDRLKYQVRMVTTIRIPLLNSDYKNIFDDLCLSYQEMFCSCDKCGKIFMLDDLIFDDEQNSLCRNCKK